MVGSKNMLWIDNLIAGPCSGYYDCDETAEPKQLEQARVYLAYIPRITVH